MFENEPYDYEYDSRYRNASDEEWIEGVQFKQFRKPRQYGGPFVPQHQQMPPPTFHHQNEWKPKFHHPYGYNRPVGEEREYPPKRYTKRQVYLKLAQQQFKNSV